MFCFRRRAIIYFMGEGAVDKALQLSGSDVGGGKAIVKPFPFPENLGWYVHFLFLNFLCFEYFEYCC